MSDLKLLRVEDGDSQKVFIDKVNSNFSNILVFGGGPYGKMGPKGAQGDQGSKGPTGSFGDPGFRGSKWTVGPSQPSPNNLEGDFWLDVLSGNRVYRYTSNLWKPYGFNLSSQDLFRVYGPLPTLSGISSKSGYFLTPLNPEAYTFVLHDSSFGSGSTGTFNPQYSKMVISTNSTFTDKKIMEFSKYPYHQNSSFYQYTPRFYWTPGTTGTYGLNFDCFEGLTINVTESNFNLRSRTSSTSIKSAGFNLNLNSQSSLFSAVTSSGNIAFDIGGTAHFSTSNITYTNNKFLIPTRLGFTKTSTSVSNPPLTIETNNTDSSNFRHKSSVPTNRNSSLFRVSNTSTFEVGFEVLANGDVYYNRKVDSIESSRSVNNSGTTGTVNVGSPSSPVTVYWVSVLPSVSITSAVSNAVVLNNGIDIVVDPSNSSDAGISLWTPTSFTYAVPPSNNNLGWLSLLGPGECLTIRVRTADPSKTFRFLGLNTNTSQSGFPDGTALNYDGNGQFVDLSGSSSVGASHVEFTIMSIASSSSTSSSRWFKVYYSAYGGNLGSAGVPWRDTAKCGILYHRTSTPF